MLPKAETLAPYLRQIDETRLYTNHGPLVETFERRLADWMGFEKKTVLSCGSGSMALIGAILALRHRFQRPGNLCLMPTYTFVATAAAAQACGYQCHLVDVDRDSWALDPQVLLQHDRLADTALVIPVAPYGRPVDFQSWQAFTNETGIPVVIDAAACLDWMLTSQVALPATIPVAVSLHTTKSFGCGEGGLLLVQDPDLIMDGFRAINFGFLDSREAVIPGLNGRMSEYHAAVGLAELDSFDSKLSKWHSVAAAYHAAVSQREDTLPGHLWTCPDVSGCYVIYEAASAEDALRAQRRLMECGIDTRFWYGSGIQAHPAYSHLSTDPLTNTHDLAGRLLGLPCYTDLSATDIGRIVKALI
ncbi:MAG: hypothetical protein COB16_02840 [Rhodobacteraceae bacterium]|nr:MAG: hypothetical protein COB16_02840 [Paracoccaceae bacterium]